MSRGAGKRGPQIGLTQSQKSALLTGLRDSALAGDVGSAQALAAFELANAIRDTEQKSNKKAGAK